jgi:phage shock protein E
MGHLSVSRQSISAKAVPPLGFGAYLTDRSMILRIFALVVVAQSLSVVACASDDDDSTAQCPAGLECGAATGGSDLVGGRTNEAGTPGQTTGSGGTLAVPQTGGSAGQNAVAGATQQGPNGGTDAETAGEAVDTGGNRADGSATAAGAPRGGSGDAAGQPATTTDLPAACSIIDGPTAQALVADGAMLVDVRTTSEYDSGHVPGAVNIPLDSLSTRLDELPDSGPIIVYCRSGSRSAQAASILCSAGFHVLDLGPMSNYPL